jgi:probable phosphoglycerate mutase
VDLLVVRHAESTWNAEHRWAGQRDPGLSAKGRRDAAELARRLAALDPPSTSDLRRARQTAQLVAPALEHHLGVAPDSAAELRGVWLQGPQGTLGWLAHC